jgi:hypothetical protein
MRDINLHNTSTAAVAAAALSCLRYSLLLSMLLSPPSEGFRLNFLCNTLQQSDTTL